MDPRTRWQRVGWSLPWLLYQVFPLADLVATERPLAVRVVAGLLLLAFTVVYLDVFRRAVGGGCHGPPALSGGPRSGHDRRVLTPPDPS